MGLEGGSVEVGEEGRAKLGKLEREGGREGGFSTGRLEVNLSPPFSSFPPSLSLPPSLPPHLPVNSGALHRVMDMRLRGVKQRRAPRLCVHHA